MKAVKRRHDWRARLQSYLASVAREPFEYGRHDCALFAAGAVEAMTGSDLARGFRGYRTEKGGIKKLRKKGYDDQFAFLEATLREIPPAFAKVGDVAVVPSDEGPALGIVQGEWIHVLRREGIANMPRLSATRAFEVS